VFTSAAPRDALWQGILNWHRSPSQAMQSWQSKDRLEQINIPTLVLWPDCDRSYSWSHPQALWQQINGSSLAVIAGCAHNAHLEKPDLFSAIVRDFLN